MTTLSDVRTRRHRLLVGGRSGSIPATGETARPHEPGDRRAGRRGRGGRPGRRRPRRFGRPQRPSSATAGAPRSNARDELERVADVIDRRREAIAADLVARARQATRRGARRGRLGRQRVPARGRRGAPADRRDDPGRGSAQAGDDVPPATRRRRRDHAVELPDQHPGRIRRSGARQRQRGHPQARADDGRDRRAARRVHRRGGRPGGPVQPADRAVGRDGVGPRPAPGRGRGRVHRLERASARPSPGSRADKELVMELGGNGPDHRPRRRRSRPGRSPPSARPPSSTPASRARPPNGSSPRTRSTTGWSTASSSTPGAIELGDPRDAATTMGPVNNEGVAAKMDDHVADARDARRGRRVHGGRRTRRTSPRGCSTSRPSSPACPTAPRSPARRPSGRSPRSRAFGDDRAILAAANASSLGLSSAVFTQRPRPGLLVRRAAPDRPGHGQRHEQLLGAAPAVRRLGGQGVRPRPGRRAAHLRGDDPDPIGRVRRRGGTSDDQADRRHASVPAARRPMTTAPGLGEHRRGHPPRATPARPDPRPARRRRST